MGYIRNLAYLYHDKPLRDCDMGYVIDGILTDQYPPHEAIGFLQRIAERGETGEEIAAAATVLQSHAVPLPLPRNLAIGDTCGTGGDRKNTFNISTMAALMATSAGAHIAKHGNRKITSPAGSADVLEALGIPIAEKPENLARSIQVLGFGFCFAPLFHPLLAAITEIRKMAGCRTIFNLAAPLANPASLTYQVIGVSEVSLLSPMANALCAMKIQRGLVVAGSDGMDEATTIAPTFIVEIKDGKIARDDVIDPPALGIPYTTLDTLTISSSRESVRRVWDIILGIPSPSFDISLLNAACVLYISGNARSIKEGIEQGRRAIISGKTLRLVVALCSRNKKT